MEIKATLNKPYSDKQRMDFIVEYNHNLGYEIQETEEALIAVYDEHIPTLEEQKEKRAQAYLLEVDPITSHIQRLRDEVEPDEEKIATLIKERAEKVAEIQARYPYPEDGQLPGNSGELEQIIASGD